VSRGPAGTRALTRLTKQRVNRALRRATGYELRRTRRTGRRKQAEQPPEPPSAEELAALLDHTPPVPRLVTAPAFILSSVRSGSTLLRLLLNSHPEICAPHELHLRRVAACALGHGGYSMRQLGLDQRELRYLLWDRIVHLVLTGSGKRRFVNKTPTDALMWPEILRCWPDARFIYLRRHPASIVDSSARARGRLTREHVVQDVLAFGIGMEQARAARPGLVLRYEDLTANPERETRRVCEFLGVEWTPTMIDYGTATHHGLRRGLGDWSDKMRSGVIHPADALPPDDRIPTALRPLARTWGYLPDE